MISLNYRDASPIYEQIKNGLKKLIVTGALKEGDKLPSVRSLAMDLAINPNTIQKAYSELERQGVIYSMKSKGSFVASSVEDLRTERKDKLFADLAHILDEMQTIGVGYQEVEEKILQQYERSTK